jgi:hypothetical protein
MVLETVPETVPDHEMVFSTTSRRPQDGREAALEKGPRDGALKTAEDAVLSRESFRRRPN